MLRASGFSSRRLGLWLRLVKGWLKNALKSLERLISRIEYAFLIKQGQSSSDVPAECLGKRSLFLHLLSVLLDSSSIGLTQLFLLALWLRWHPEFGREDRTTSFPNLFVFTRGCYGTFVLSPHLLLDKIVQRRRQIDLLRSVRGGLSGELLLFAALILIVEVHEVWAAVDLAQGYGHVLQLTDMEWFVNCILIDRIVCS